MRRVLASGLALVAGASLAAAPASSAAPYAAAGAHPARVFALSAGGGFDRVEVHLAQRRARVGGGSAGSAAVAGPAWTACVHGWTASSFFHGCSEPVQLRAEVAEGAASGRLRFTLRDDFWGDTAVVDLTLEERDGSLPELQVSSTPYADGLRVSSAPHVVLFRPAVARGSVTITTVRNKRQAVRRHVVAPGTAAHVDEAVVAAAHVSG